MSGAKKARTTEDEPVNLVGSKTSRQQLSVRAYLDQTLVPVLLQAMTALVKARPEDEDPAVYFANWILEHQKKNPIGSIPSSKKKDHEEEEEEVEEEEKAEADMEEEEENNAGGVEESSSTTAAAVVKEEEAEKPAAMEEAEAAN